MNAAEAWAAQRGLAFLTLQTGAANKPARTGAAASQVNSQLGQGFASIPRS